MTVARILFDSPAAGAWNMAVDEALLIGAAERGAATLRFYRWQDATLSLGYFQSHAARQAHTASAECPLVRRATGGGAIVHHHELTYSFVAPLGDRLSADAALLYDTFHDTLIDTLRVFGVDARRCEAPQTHPPGQEPFLCFQRRTAGDVLVGDYKIGGSAQRRHHGAVLQHGSVLLMQSPHAPELPGVAEISMRVLSYPELITAWTPALARRLKLEFEPGELDAAECALAEQVERAKFSAAAWTERR